MADRKFAKLSDVADFYAGASLPDGVPFKQQDAGYLLMRVSDLNLPGNEVKLTSSRNWSASPGNRASTCPADSVIIPKRGGAIGTNKKRISVRPCILDPNLMAINPHPDVLDHRYLYHWFLGFDLLSIANGSSVPQLNKKDLRPLEIPLPSTDVQRKVADVLDRVDTLRAKRRAAIALLDDLAQSLFLDMFGDPVVNERGWNRVRFEDLLEGIDSGKSPTCLDRSAAEGEWGVLKLGAVTSCRFKPEENKALPSAIAPVAKHEVHPGDLLFSRKNTRELVAACALVDETPPKMLLPDLIFRFNFKRDAPVDRQYIQQLLVNRHKRRKVQELASGSAGSMPNISKSRLAGLDIELPPLELQHEFGRRVRAVEESRRAHQDSLRELNDLFGSLQQRAFRGELWDD
ncbi:restriction endonuclease subunit S [Actinomadura chokoriensis]|uniref:restriction endonuclease subunit S n=1 Tax=Actinomadura chokoriensis TaxID=454156 RepID=UPI0031FA4538